ncbi:MAG: hypothetical protein NXH86_03995 [Flavobacteriaceae bacterium]|uniref:hypothetical protein n=1 Tax=Flagellimonas sp. TaxID=2058762 RepID=UPI003BAD79AC|nr:hypothetical protein [Flavobacteriaceae bacterium]
MEAIEKILGFKYSDSKKYDRLLELDCMLYTNLGTDSTKKEGQEVKTKSRKIYQAIRTLDTERWQLTAKQLGQSFIDAMDKK